MVAALKLTIIDTVLDHKLLVVGADIGGLANDG